MTGLSAGWVLPISVDLTRRNGYSVGGQLEYGFRPNQSAWLEISQTGLTCAGDGARDYGIDVPHKQGYRLTYFETTKGLKISNRIGGGLRFRQPDRQKWGRLGLGLGYVLEYQKAFDISINWQNENDPNDTGQENYFIPKEHKAIGYLHADLGMEWRLGRSWIGSVNVWKEAKGHFAHGMPGYFGIKAGVGHRF